MTALRDGAGLTGVLGTWTRAWADLELAPWRNRGLTQAAVSAAIDLGVAKHGAMFRYDVCDGEVICRPKTPYEIGPGVDDAIIDMVRRRADAYRELLQSSLSGRLSRRNFTLGLEVSDMPSSYSGVPLFSFQKRRGDANLLLPDIDLLQFGYFEHDSWCDATPYRDKWNRAIFVGSTTGETLTLEKVEALATPRLRAAQAFKASRRVVFKLPNVVQCESEEAAAAVRALDVGGDYVPWSEQMRYRHILSIDGNGATCSRVAIALQSNSTLLKYDSDHELFYFKGLKPWVHYVPIAEDGDVEAAVADSGRRPHRYARIARAGRRFFERHLGRIPCRRYVTALLEGYVDLLDGG